MYPVGNGKSYGNGYGKGQSYGNGDGWRTVTI